MNIASRQTPRQFSSVRLVLFIGLLLSARPLHSFEALPGEGETRKQAYERVLSEFEYELSYLRLDYSRLSALQAKIKNLDQDQAGKLQTKRWPGYYQIVSSSQGTWFKGPRNTAMRPDILKAVYNDFLHYRFYLAELGIWQDKEILKTLQKIQTRISKPGLKLLDQNGKVVSLSSVERQAAMRMLTLEACLDFVSSHLQFVLSQARLIIEQNWSVEGFWPEKLESLKGKIYHESVGADPLKYWLCKKKPHKRYSFYLNQQRLTGSEKLVLGRAEKAALVKHFSLVSLPSSTGQLVKQLNRKFTLREQIRSRRRVYLEKLKAESRAFDLNATPLLDPSEFQ